MKRFLLALLAVALAIGNVEAGYEALFQEVQAAAWAVYVRSTGGMNAVCSASAYYSDTLETRLLSAGHCFTGMDLDRTDFLVTQDHRAFYKATLRKTGLKIRAGKTPTSTQLDDYAGHDWATITVSVGGQRILPVGDSTKLQIGEDLVIVGVPFGLDFLAVQGIVGSKDISLSQLVWNHYFGANIFLAGGNSGSGIISANQKAIVGIVTAGPGSQSSMAIFMPVQLLPADALR